MAMTYVHICDVCGYRLEDTCNDEVPKGWFKIKIFERKTAWCRGFIACSICMKEDKEENKFCKMVCDLFRNKMDR